MSILNFCFSFYTRFVETELTKHQLSACERWGFNFVHGYPLVDHKQYIWERVQSTNAIPQMYALSRAAHVRQISNSSVTASSSSSSIDLHSTFNDLLDERAERSNRAREILDLSSEDEIMEKSRLSIETATGTSTTTTTTSSATVNTEQQTHHNQQQPTAQRCSPREKRQPRITGQCSYIHKYRYFFLFSPH